MAIGFLMVLGISFCAMKTIFSEMLAQNQTMIRVMIPAQG
jgi:hypothetical protein